jgi:transcriptional regulator with XRE-family HTH domain
VPLKVAVGKNPMFAQTYLESYCIGMKLRALRMQKKLTLSRLAAETGLSTALLSKLETDRMIPTLPTLATICRIYGVGLGHFFAKPERHTLSVTRKAHLQPRGQRLESVTTVPLHAQKSTAGIIAEMVEVPTSGADLLHGPENDETCGLV